MAKLSKSGTTVLWQMEKETPQEDGATASNRYAMRSDGTVLSKLVITRVHYRHDYGWKVSRKKADADTIKAVLLAKGYEIR